MNLWHTGARFFGLQTLVHSVRVTTGLVLVNLLLADEYALFTIAFAAFTVAAVVADGGVTSAFMSLGAGVRDDPSKLRGLLDDVLRWRVVLAFGGLLAGAPFLGWSLLRLGYRGPVIAASLVLLALYLWASIWQATWGTVLRLQGEYRRLQLVDLYTNVGRLAVVLSVITLWRHGLLALGASVLSQGAACLAIRHFGLVYVDGGGVGDYTPHIREVVRAALPGVVFYAFQSQISVGLLALLGTRFAVAGAGALARIAVVYTLLGPFVRDVLAPRFAAEKGTAASRQFGKTLVAAAGLAAGLSWAVWVCRVPILSLLGASYRGLELELVVVAASAGIGFVGSTAAQLGTARAWVRRSWLSIPVVLTAQVLAVLVFDVSTLRGALYLGLVTGLASLGVTLYQAWLGSAIRAPGSPGWDGS